MSTLTDTLVLPAPFDTAKSAGAWSYHSKRQLTWTLHAPDGADLHRNRYTWLWVELYEQVPWKGEPLYLTAERRVLESGQREGLTDSARQRLSADLVPAVAAYGFDRLWHETRRLRDCASTARDHAAQARHAAAWWDDKAVLDQLYQAGHVEIVIVPIAPLGRRPDRVAVLQSTRAQPCYEEIAGRAMFDGEQLGWMTSAGTLVPMLDGNP